MFRFSSPITLKLARGELLAWRGGAARLRVLSGCAWVTQEHDADDHFLQAREALQMRCNSLVLISAERELELHVESQPAWHGWVVSTLRCASNCAAALRSVGNFKPVRG